MEHFHLGVIARLVKNQHLRYIYYGRIAEKSKLRLVKCLFSFLQLPISSRSGIEIPIKNGNIGSGINLIHPYNITVNDSAIISNNVVLFKGCTIGSVRSGKRVGTPVIGNNVVVGCNSMICGGITVGNNVLIAANSFVDFNVPDNSLVIGNPGKIIAKDNPTQDYIMERKCY